MPASGCPPSTPPQTRTELTGGFGYAFNGRRCDAPTDLDLGTAANALTAARPASRTSNRGCRIGAQRRRARYLRSGGEAVVRPRPDVE